VSDIPPPASPLSDAQMGSVTPSGIILIDKHLGPTSMHVCANVRARFRKGGAPKRIKVGHAGTLDPMASGLLTVMVGKATRRCNQFMASRKQYRTIIDLSRTSDSFDLDGKVVDVAVACPPTRDDLDRAVRTFVGEIQQSPPAFSAIKIGGVRSYDLAREGREVLLQARPVTIHAIEVISYSWPMLELLIDCGKGTYIRSIARDLGIALSVGGVLTMLRRTKSGEFDVGNAQTLASLPSVLTQADLLVV